jgi:hypothetical protein
MLLDADRQCGSGMLLDALRLVVGGACACQRPFDVGFVMHRQFAIVIASPLFIGIVLSVLGRAAAIEPSCCWCVGHTSQRWRRGGLAPAPAPAPFCAAERPQLTSSVCCGAALPRSAIEETSTSLVNLKCSGHHHAGAVVKFRRLNT